MNIIVMIVLFLIGNINFMIVQMDVKMELVLKKESWKYCRKQKNVLIQMME